MKPDEFPGPSFQKLPDPPTTYDILKNPSLFEKNVTQSFEPTPGCHCRATVVEADPPQGSFWVWAVGVYHTFPNFNCVLSNGPAGVLWDEGDVYEFDACTESDIIFEFAVSPNPGNSSPVDVHINLKCGYTGWPPAPMDPNDLTSLDVYFHAEADSTVIDKRIYTGLDSDCYINSLE